MIEIEEKRGMTFLEHVFFVCVLAVPIAIGIYVEQKTRKTNNEARVDRRR